MNTQTTAGDNSDLRFITIPLEVLLQITSNLTTPEYGNLRRTCKQVEQTLFNSFSREFFTKRQFMFTEFSLQALVDISKSRFSSYLIHVIINLERPSLSHFPAQGQIVHNPPFHMSDKYNRMRQEYVDHLSLINTSQDVEMLAEAFSNMSSLETIGMRDFNSRSRHRDYPSIRWRSYGAPTFERETGSQLETCRQSYIFIAGGATFPDQANYISHVFLALLRALGKADSRPKRFEVILRESSLYDQAFHLPKYADHIVQPVLDNLRTLFLDLNSEFPSAFVNVDNVAVSCPSYFLRRFLSRISQLEHLRMNFQNYLRGETNDVISWLSKPASVVSPNITPGTVLLKPPQPVDLPALRQLDIGMTTTQPQILLGLIRKYRATLHTISLHKVCLLQTNPGTSGERVNLWAKFFDQLSKLDLNLSGINMSFLSQEKGGNQHRRPITFKDSREPHTKRWAGTDSQSGLRDFAGLVEVTGPDHDTESSHSDGSDENHSDVSMNSDSDLDD